MNFFSWSAELNVFFMAMLPISELRGAIPLGLTVYHLPLEVSLGLAIIGNLIPVIFLLKFLDPVSRFLMRHSFLMNRFFSWLFERTRRRFEKKSQKYGALIALALFVAIPLPITGAWTGSVAAFLFNIPFSKALISITIGVLMAAVIVTLTSLGIISLF